MRAVSDPEMAQWLGDFVPDAENFDWDEGNKEKNIKRSFLLVEEKN
ncbi:MAG: hypothetical protein HY538_04015 [Deltaproteobacteria bacterium]|nr:hypothetical protein [Deltaproteobacteria bacterium]